MFTFWVYPKEDNLVFVYLNERFSFIQLFDIGELNMQISFWESCIPGRENRLRAHKIQTFNILALVIKMRYLVIAYINQQKK